jgi:hypothetical protein
MPPAHVIALTVALLAPGFAAGDPPPVIAWLNSHNAESLKPENIDDPWFKERWDVLEILGTHLGDLAIGDKELTRRYEAAFSTTTDTGRKLIIAALKVCGDETSKEAVADWLNNAAFAPLKNDLEALQRHLKDAKRKHYRDVPVKTPHDVDMLWGNFYITGDYEPVARILDVFDGPDDKETAVLRRVARFSLGANLQRHKKLVELIQKHRKERGAGSEKVLSELILEFPGGRQ